MKITLHVGPHKTGTTTLQSWLLESSVVHLEEFGVYYPPVQEIPPGHAAIAWRTLGLHKYQADPDLLKTIVNEAAERGAKHLVLSSECFCMGLSQGTLKNLRVLNEYGSVDLVITLTPLPNRFLSEVAEEIKHAAKFDLAEINLPDFCLRRPGLWPDLVNELRDGIRSARTHVILGEKKNPEILTGFFAEILGVPKPQKFVKQNPRFPHSRTRLLNFVNTELTSLTPKKRRELSGKLDSILQAEGLGNTVRPICLPETATGLLDRMWKLQLDLLLALHNGGEIQLYRSDSH